MAHDEKAPGTGGQQPGKGKKGFRDLRGTLQAYMSLVVAGGFLAGGLVAPEVPDQRADFPLALLFCGLLVLAKRYEIHLAPKLKVSTDTAVLFSMALLFEPSLVLLMVALCTLFTNALAKRPWYDALFNASQVSLSAALSSAAYLALAPGRLDQVVDLSHQLPALVAAALVMYCVNALLVDFAISIHLGQRPLVGWWPRHRGDLPHHVALFLLGTLPALSAHTQPWSVVLVAVPIVIVYISLRDLVRLRVQTRDAVEALADMVDLRDPYTHGHSQRVAAYAGLVARGLGLPTEEAEVIKAAARVHDIGKIAVPDRVLLKPGRLDETEFREMRRHQEVGAQILDRFPDFRDGQQYVLSHHERPDGNGYGRGLKSSQIPLGASIIAVADSFDAMTSDRPYRRALSVEAAIQELRRFRGAQWDERAVDALLRVVSEGTYQPVLEQMAVAGA